MFFPRFIIPIIFIIGLNCRRSEHAIIPDRDRISLIPDSLLTDELNNSIGNEALLLTRFKSLAELKTVIQIKYIEEVHLSARSMPRKPEVRLTYKNKGREITSTLKKGVSQTDFLNARDGNLWTKFSVGLKSPYAVLNKRNLMAIEHLGRKRSWMFGKGDVAFYDLAEKMVSNISEEDFNSMPSEDLSEKGYLNTFNHVIAQAFMTSIFSERLADFVADVHERFNLPELITGNFTDDQVKDLEKGPVDNYVDMINNECGQELGKILRNKYNIKRKTYWSTELLASYLNDIQSYQSWAFQISFNPFRASDEIVIRFATKINNFRTDVPKFRGNE